jgi:hypothetical protein
MLINFDQLPENSRIWIYPSLKKLEQQEIEKISAILREFISGWKSHGREITGSFKFILEQFVIIGMDENSFQASGCSIDSSVHIIKEIENRLNLTLTDRSKQFLFSEQNLIFAELGRLKQKVLEGEIKKDTMVVDNTITEKRELEKNWIVPAEKSWMKKYFTT